MSRFIMIPAGHLRGFRQYFVKRMLDISGNGHLIAGKARAIKACAELNEQEGHRKPDPSKP